MSMGMGNAAILQFPATETPGEPGEVRDVRLHVLRLTNFKCVRDLALGLHLKNAAIFGSNASGKTTLADAWAWLLTGKDSSGAADAAIKTLGADGEPLHDLDHVVAVSLAVGRDGHRPKRTVTLARTMSEKWTRKRGAPSPEFSGHVTAYEIDGVPVQEKEWQKRIDELLAPATPLVLLTDPSAFCAKLHWKERRRLVLDACGDIADADVFSADRDLARLQGILNGRTIDEFRAVAAASLKKSNQELLTLPARLDEAQRSLANLDVDGDALDGLIASASARLAEARAAEAAILAGGDVAQTKAALMAAENAANELAMVRRNYDDAERSRLEAGRRDAADKLAATERKLTTAAKETERARDSATSLEGKVAAKRAEWHAAKDAPQTVAPVEDACAACGQPLPADRVEAARQKAQEAANLARAQRLTAIQEAGAALARTLADEKARFDLCVGEQTTLEELVAALRDDVANAERGIRELQPQPVSPKEAGLREEAERLRRLLADGDAMRQEQASGARRERQDAEASVIDLQKRAAQVAADARTRDRIAELTYRQRELVGEVERLQGELELCDRFVTTQVAMLEERIQRTFGGVRFRMYEQQINGGIAECCDVTYRGVPYSDLNHAAKVNVGLECIRVLQGHFGVRLPVWVDGRESVTELAPLPSQVISLVVSPEDKELRIVCEEAQGQ